MIYLIFNTISQKGYLGRSVDPKIRWSGHKCDLRKQRHTNSHLQNAWNQYGEDAFIFVVLIRCSNRLDESIEQFFLDEYVSKLSELFYNQSTSSTTPDRDATSRATKKQWSSRLMREKMCAGMRGPRRWKTKCDRFQDVFTVCDQLYSDGITPKTTIVWKMLKTAPNDVCDAMREWFKSRNIKRKYQKVTYAGKPVSVE